MAATRCAVREHALLCSRTSKNRSRRFLSNPRPLTCSGSVVSIPPAARANKKGHHKGDHWGAAGGICRYSIHGRDALRRSSNTRCSVARTSENRSIRFSSNPRPLRASRFGGSMSLRPREPKHKRATRLCDPLCFGAAGGIRTPDHLVRSQVLYPTELRPRGEAKCTRIWAGIAESSPLLRGVERAAGPEARAWRAPLSLDPGLRRDDNEFEFRQIQCA